MFAGWWSINQQSYQKTMCLTILSMVAFLSFLQSCFLQLMVKQNNGGVTTKTRVTSSSSSLLEEQIKIVLKSEIAFAAKDFSNDSYNNSLLFPNVGILRGGGDY